MSRDSTSDLGVSDLVATTISSERSLEIGTQLIDNRQRLLAIVRELIAGDDVENLSVLRDGVCAAHLVLREVAPAAARVRPPGEKPYRRGEPAPVHALRALAALGLALTDRSERAGGHLRVFRQWSDHSGLALPSSPPANVVSAAINTKHAPALRSLAEAGELDLLSLLWMAALDGWRPPKHTIRQGPAVQVLFDLGSEGRRATLSLSSLPKPIGLPGGLVPDPATMALGSADERFGTALAAAWQAAAGPARTPVLWSLTDQAGPVTRVTGESLSLAFAVLFDEQRRLSRPMWGPVTVRRLRPRVAIVGRIDPRRPDQASSVSAYDTKLSAVGEGMRVVLPHVDRDSALESNRTNGGGAQLCPVPTWRQAAKTARSIDRSRLLVIASVVLLVLASSAFGLYRYSESKRDTDQARVAAADLAARAVTMQSADPVLSAKLALTARHIDPNNSRAVEALREVLENNRNVVRTWQADPSRVDALAVNEQANRVVTSGSDGMTKVWTLSPTVLIGELPKYSRQIVAAQIQPMAAAVVDNNVALYDIRTSKPVDLGYVPKPNCSDNGNVVALRFVNDDNTLVVVWKDGAVASYDVATRSLRQCVAWSDVLAPLRVSRPLPVDKVVAADIVDSEAADSGEVVLLLSTNDVISARPGARDTRIEVSRTSVNGDVSLIAASTEVIAVATAQGVAVWSRAGGTLLANPAGGFGFRPRVLRESEGYLVLGGDTGTALVQVGEPSRDMPESLSTLRGGAATVAAISENNIVSGGPGGRVSVISDASGELALPQELTTTAMVFLPDGRFVAADTREFGDRSEDLASDGLVLVDPKVRWFPDAPKTVWTYAADPSQMYITDVAVAPKLVAAAGQLRGRGSVLVWPWDDHTSPVELLLDSPEEKNLPADQRSIAAVRLAADGSAVVARHRTGQVGIWSTRDWTRLGTIDLPTRSTSIAVHAGQAVLVAGFDQSAELVEVDIATARITRRIPTPRVEFVAATDDGSRLIALTADGNVQGYDRNLNEVGDSWRLAPSGDVIADVAMDHAGRRLAVAQGHRVLLYDLDTKTLAMPPLDATGSTITSISWSQDGQLLSGTVTPSVNGGQFVTRPRVWKTGELDWTSQVCKWAGGGLTPEEWSQYVPADFAYTDLCVTVN